MKIKEKKYPEHIAAPKDNDSASVWRSQNAKRTLTVLGILFFIGIITWYFFFHPYVSTDDARVAAVIIRVANQGVSGRIENVYVKEGDSVVKGKLLVELDHRTATALLDRAKARARLTAADLKRAVSLASSSGMSIQQLDKIRADAQTADADLRLAEIALDNTYLKSPVDGVVVQKLSEEGNILENNQTAVTIVDIEHAWISANIEETEVARVKPGQKVKITVDEGGTLYGNVVEVRRAAAAQFALIPSDNAAGNFTKLVQRIPIKIEFDPRLNRVLRVGQSVEIQIRVL